MRHAHRPRPGFTLVELLVVIGIISLLAALLLPVLDKAARTAEGASCRNKLRQLCYGVRVYLNSFGQYFPVAWHESSSGSGDLSHVSYHRFLIKDSMATDTSHLGAGSEPAAEAVARKFRTCRDFWQDPGRGWTADYFAPLLVFKGHLRADGTLDPANTAPYDRHAQFSELVQSVPSTQRPLLADVNASYANPEAEDDSDPEHQAEMRQGWSTYRFNGIEVFLGVGKSLRRSGNYDTERFDFRHSKAVNVLFLDGHVDGIRHDDKDRVRKLHNRWNKLTPPADE